MPTVITSPDKIIKHPDESIVVTFDFTNILASSEVLSSVTSVTQAGGGGSDLTLGTPTINSSAITSSCTDIAIGKAVQLTVSGGVSVTNYTLTAEVVSDLPQTRISIGPLLVSET